ncbi:hypothetical protein [Vulcanococcus limneticus]|uniref:hypothetical protein n=1 Tax=Vulcanococcus limneticus TaxID=2170428 RepID=UPI00398BC497
MLKRPGPCLIPLLLAGGGAIALLPPARADVPQPPGVAASLALPGCRQALGLPASTAPAELLRADPALPAKLAAAPACRNPGDALSRLERLEQELAASRQRIAAQQSQLAAETSRQDNLAADLAQLRRQLTGQPASPGAAIPGAAISSAPAAAQLPAEGALPVATPLQSPRPATGSPPTIAPASPAPVPVAATPSAPAPPATAAAEGSPNTLSAPASAGAPSAPASTATYTPGKGFALQAGGATLRLWAEAKLLGFSSSRYTFNPGQPLIVSPKDPAASYDLSAQQSMVYAAFRGPKWGSWTPGAFAIFWLQDNLLAEGYSFTPVVAYGEIGNGAWRVAAGQNFDVFAPRDPDTLPNGKLAATGNPGAYRPQFRVERNFEAGPGFGGVVQLAASSPVTTALPSNVDLANLQGQEIVEDNGWPNLEARLNFGFGAYADRAGGRSLRPVELGVSGIVGQLRVLDNIRPSDPLTLVSDRSTVNVWGAAIDGQIALGRRFGLSGELYTGQGMGEYMAGILQTYNRATNQAVPTAGGWGQLYVYLADNLRLNLGYGIDNAQDSGLFGLQVNSGIFANLLWDVNPWLQLGLEGNYKLTTYDVFGDKNAWVVISQVMFRL